MNILGNSTIGPQHSAGGRDDGEDWPAAVPPDRRQLFHS